ncbi:MAG: hypothetical protein A2252_07665 [Elusimicrobia bacterium RIFOXYA2_FULL_39_19]|nr:MAG: hypothetical protein A2252_07665 [Elusimicrobia bacterium RIFOXYA2_FULL_39_19]
MLGFVYILKSLKNNRYYIGSTINLDNRIREHNNGEVHSTKYIRPLKIEFYQEFENIETAKKVELRLKRYKNKSIIERIIAEKKIRPK